MKIFRAAIALTTFTILTHPLVYAGGGSEQQAARPASKTIVVSILPQAYFVQRIAGDRFKPVVLVGQGQSPHSYEPTPRQMAELSSAAAWMRIGIDFEKGLAPKIAKAYPALPIFDLSAGVKFRRLEAHSHEGEEEHSDEATAETGLDPHVWLGKEGALVMAANIRDSLTKLDPAGKATFAANHEAFIADVNAVFSALKPSLAPMRGKAVFVYHPAFGYFLDEFGIEQEAVETGGKEPTQKQLTALIREAKADGAKVIFVQAQFPASAAKTVADAIGGVVVPMDDLAPDWLDNLQRLGKAIENAAR
jgi:zinc transport system substrate-binding protein